MTRVDMKWTDCSLRAIPYAYTAYPQEECQVFLDNSYLQDAPSGNHAPFGRGVTIAWLLVVGLRRSVHRTRGRRMSRNSIKNAMGAMALSVGLLSLPQTANAGAIQYTVNQTIGSGSVTGTITTDGTIGTLAAADVISWNLLLNDGTKTGVEASGANAAFVVVEGSALTATLTTLTYDYSSASGSDFYFGDTSTPYDGELCYTSYSNCWGPTGVGLYNVGGDGSVYTALTGSQTIASDGRSVPVPEPATFALFGAGLVSLSALRRRRKAKP
jgi:PEP-CTERM motif